MEEDERTEVAFDMETQDPDDVLTLCLLATHPRVRLVSVTVNPGSRHQVGLVRRVLGLLGREDVPVGSRNPDHPKPCVSAFHYRWLGDVPQSDPDGQAVGVLFEALVRHPSATVLTGGPLTNVWAVLGSHGLRVDRMVLQGGFAGDSVVPPDRRLQKFSGRETCPTFNFNGDVRAALSILSYGGVGHRLLVSKNVCHGVAWDRDMHERMRPVRSSHAGLDLAFEAMDLYLERRPEGKLLHDPLAACAAIEPCAFDFREVEVYRERGEWGSRLREGTDTFISVHVLRDYFEQVLIGG